MKNTILFFLLFAPMVINAQKYGFKTDVEKVGMDGYYKILLSPEITSRMSSGFTDVRIFDREMNEIPYIYYAEKPVQQKTLFREYEVVKKEYRGTFGYTELIIRNPEKREINNISLKIRNADVSKWLKLSGSDDMDNWYVVKDKYHFYSFDGGDDTHEIKIINFPLSNYEYYQLLVYDYFNNPINIEKAGYYDNTREIGKYSKVKVPVVNQVDSASVRQSFVTMLFDPQQYLDKMVFTIEGPELYRRNARLQIREKRIHRKKITWHYRTIKELEFSSNSTNTIFLSSLCADTLLLVIDNYDDKPLLIQDVNGLQLNKYLKAKMIKDHIYTLYFGDAFAPAAVYDMKYFRDEIPEELAILNTGQIMPTGLDDKDKGNNLMVSKIWLWIVIGVVVAFLLFMSAKMIRDTKK